MESEKDLADSYSAGTAASHLGYVSTGFAELKTFFSHNSLLGRFNLSQRKNRWRVSVHMYL